MGRIKYIILTLGIIAGFGLAAVPATVSADVYNPFPTCDNTTSKDSSVCASKDPNGLATFIKTIVNTLLYVLGAVSVITIIIAGVRYTTSHGDAKAVQVAKDTLLYAIVGLVVALLAFAIVNFVVVNVIK